MKLFPSDMMQEKREFKNSKVGIKEKIDFGEGDSLRRWTWSLQLVCDFSREREREREGPHRSPKDMLPPSFIYPLNTRSFSSIIGVSAYLCLVLLTFSTFKLLLNGVFFKTRFNHGADPEINVLV